MAADLSFAGRVALVTGAGAGLGRIYAKELARLGCKVVVNDFGGISTGTKSGFQGQKDIAKAQAVVDEIKAAGGDAVADGGSVTEYEDVKQMVALAQKAYGKLDIAICNAGIIRTGGMDKLAELDYDLTFDTHVKGTFNVCKHAWPLMSANKYGRIVCVSSAGVFGGAGGVLYGGAKAAMIGIAKSLKFDARKVGISINVMMPGARTAMNTTDKWGPEHVAPVVLYLCHEDCPDNGEVIYAEDGKYGRVQLFKSGNPLRSPNPESVMSTGWVAQHWSEVMHVNEKGESTAPPGEKWVEMNGSVSKARGPVFGRQPARKSKL